MTVSLPGVLMCVAAALPSPLTKQFTQPYDEVRSVAFSPDGARLAINAEDGRLRVFNLAEGRLERTWMASGPMAFSADSSTLAVGARVIRLASGDMVDLTPDKERVGWHPLVEPHSVALSADGKHYAAGTTGTIANVYVFDVAAHQLLHTFTGEMFRTVGTHATVAFLPDAPTVVFNRWDGTVNFHDARNGKQLQSLQTHSWHADDIALSPDGRLMVVHGTDGLLSRNGRSILPAPGGSMFPVPGTSRTLKVLEVKSGRKVVALDGFFPLTFSADGRRAAYISEYEKDAAGLRHPRIKVVQLDGLGSTLEMKGNRHRVFALAFHPRAPVLASAGWEPSVLLWRTDDGAPLGRLIVFDEADWLLLAADGRVDGTARGLALLGTADGGAPSEKHTPGLMRALLHGAAR